MSVSRQGQDQICTHINMKFKLIPGSLFHIRNNAHGFIKDIFNSRIKKELFGLILLYKNNVLTSKIFSRQERRRNVKHTNWLLIIS
jgi:hypothetical protein